MKSNIDLKKKQNIILYADINVSPTLCGTDKESLQKLSFYRTNGTIRFFIVLTYNKNLCSFMFTLQKNTLVILMTFPLTIGCFLHSISLLNSLSPLDKYGMSLESFQ